MGIYGNILFNHKKQRYIDILDLPPTQDAIVANEGWLRDPRSLKMFHVILVVTIASWVGGRPNLYY